MKRQWDIEELIEHITLIEDDLSVSASRQVQLGLGVCFFSNGSSMKGFSFRPQ